MIKKKIVLPIGTENITHHANVRNIYHPRIIALEDRISRGLLWTKLTLNSLAQPVPRMPHLKPSTICNNSQLYGSIVKIIILYSEVCLYLFIFYLV